MWRAEWRPAGARDGLDGEPYPFPYRRAARIGDALRAKWAEAFPSGGSS
jgi:hypothetical protein